MNYLTWLAACLFVGWSHGLAQVQGIPLLTEQTWQCTPCDKACDTDAYAAPGTCPHCGMALVPRPTETALAQQSQTISFP